MREEDGRVVGLGQEGDFLAVPSTCSIQFTVEWPRKLVVFLSEAKSQDDHDYWSKIRMYGQHRYVTLFSYPDVSMASHRYLLQRSQELKDTRDQNTGFAILSGLWRPLPPPLLLQQPTPDMLRLWNSDHPLEDFQPVMLATAKRAFSKLAFFFRAQSRQ
ncbi:hypothetical protein M0804_009560 [Polistes exclamans]|nr:hypothetical protein M0804_009560 [Polistes exclamans]